MGRSQPVIEPLGDTAVLVTFGYKADTYTRQSVQAFFRAVSEHPFSWMTEASPAYTSVALYYNPIKLVHIQNPYEHIKKDIQSIIDVLDFKTAADRTPRIVRIPVCYGGDFGPDLDEVAACHALKPNEVIRLHSETNYLVHMIGFTPGFPYLGGMSEVLATPRRATPRLRIPAGSVGIAGKQTGVYPLDSPGGWNIIGRTPLALFCPGQDPPCLLSAGDVVRFYPISSDEFINGGVFKDGD
ncbi:MAG: 5-oxoprolinase subunit PxpB [Tuberibacillus sp.]